MSKYVKDLLAQDIQRRLDGVEDALLVNVIGLDANQSVVLRKQLREQDIHLLVVKNSLARRATEGTPLAQAFEGHEGSLAVVWGAEDFVLLAKQVNELDKGREFEEFQTQGGVMDGEHLTADKVKEVAMWPTREEQLSILMGQALSPGGRLLSQLEAPGGLLASQIEKKSEGEGEQEQEEQA